VVHGIYEHSGTEEALTCLHSKFYKSLNDYETAWKNALIVLVGGVGIVTYFSLSYEAVVSSEPR
jgi:hypothetical protein